jgi:excisionase family DNA binding protein
MALVEKFQNNVSYPPRAMRAERAAAYLDISKSMFLQWVAEGKMPKGTRIGGLRIWDREDIDAAYEALKESEGNQHNPIEAHYGIGDN